MVRFRVPVDEWPAGTTGTLLLAYEHGGVVEVSGSDDEVSIHYDDVEVVWSTREEQLALQS